MGRGDRQRIHTATLTGAIIALRDTLRLSSGDGREERLRSDWPELAERIDQATGLIDW